MVGLHSLMPQRGSHPTPHLSWLLEKSISCLHKPKLSRTNYPGR